LADNGIGLSCSQWPNSTNSTSRRLVRRKL